MLYGRDWK
jgi:hypothetical protein